MLIKLRCFSVPSHKLKHPVVIGQEVSINFIRFRAIREIDVNVVVQLWLVVIRSPLILYHTLLRSKPVTPYSRIHVYHETCLASLYQKWIFNSRAWRGAIFYFLIYHIKCVLLNSYKGYCLFHFVIIYKRLINR